MPMINLHVRGDGSHRGLADWYPRLEEQIVEALKNKKPFTTGWYGSKHEIASARITYDTNILVEASVSDDFDTPGLGELEIPFTEDLDTIRNAIYRAWDAALENQICNRDWAMWIIRQGSSWVETYLVDISGYGLDSPPGDNYHKWGWQEECDIPEDVKEKLEDAIHSCTESITVGGYTAIMEGSEED